MAMAMMVSTHLWLGGAVSPNRDTSLLQQMAGQVRRIALCRPLLIAIDGLNTYLSVFRDAFRTGMPRSKTPPPPWIKKQGRGRLPNRLLFRMSRYAI